MAAALTIAWLEDQGRLDIKTFIAKSFTKFARHGKGDITTRDVLTHRSGLLMPGSVDQLHVWADRQAVQEALIKTIPTFPRGTLVDHPHEYGWLLNEIVLPVDGRSMPQLSVKKFADPLGLPDLYNGLAGRELGSIGFSYRLGKDRVMVAGQDVATHFESQIPATSMITDSSSLASFYNFILAGGQTPGFKQLTSCQLIEAYSTGQV